MKYLYVEKGGITSPQGFTAGSAQASIKKPGRYDLTMIYSKTAAAGAGVFTQNKFKAAPVQVSMKHLEDGKARGFIVNSGCANACTGDQGYKDAVKMAEAMGLVVGCPGEEILVSSTGVIGAYLPMEKVLNGIEAAGKDLSEKGGSTAALAIMTTDTYPKEIALQLELDGKTITIGAMAKGSGMIHPNMATMLGFITTDAAVSPGCLKEALLEANQDSFNMITVDGDTSTNDMLLVLANGMAGNDIISDREEPSYLAFKEALREVCIQLAVLMARDGEGATKLMEVQVVGASTDNDARLAARSIAGSNLVKTALYGEDANWGRIICALGYSGAEFDPSRVDVYLGGLKVAENGGGRPFDEEEARKILQEKSVIIKVDLKQGERMAKAWGCDLSYDYVKINADYRT